MILERLDMGLANEEWFAKFPMASEKHLISLVSDHTPLLFTIDKKTMQKKREKQFKFENIWGHHRGCETIIREGWQSSNIFGFQALAAEVAHCGKRLTKWNSEVFGNLSHCIKQKESDLE